MYLERWLEVVGNVEAFICEILSVSASNQIFVDCLLHDGFIWGNDSFNRATAFPYHF